MRSLERMSLLVGGSSLGGRCPWSLIVYFLLGRLRCNLEGRKLRRRELLGHLLSRIRRGRFFGLIRERLFVFRLLSLR